MERRQVGRSRIAFAGTYKGVGYSPRTRIPHECVAILGGRVPVRWEKAGRYYRLVPGGADGPDTSLITLSAGNSYRIVIPLGASKRMRTGGSGVAWFVTCDGRKLGVQAAPE